MLSLGNWPQDNFDLLNNTLTDLLVQLLVYKEYSADIYQYSLNVALFVAS